jgi:hypothetical protein
MGFFLLVLSMAVFGFEPGTSSCFSGSKKRNRSQFQGFAAGDEDGFCSAEEAFRF